MNPVRTRLVPNHSGTGTRTADSIVPRWLAVAPGRLGSVEFGFVREAGMLSCTEAVVFRQDDILGGNISGGL